MQHWHSDKTTETSGILTGRIQNVVKMRQLSKDIDTSGGVHICQTKARNGTEVHDNIQIIQQFGLSSVPPVGTYLASLAESGLNDNAFVIGTHNPVYHPKNLKSGELKIYDGFGQSLYLTSDKKIFLTGQEEIDILIGNTTIFSISNGKVIINADVTVNGSVVASGDVSGNGTSLHSHTHTSGKEGSPTSSPN
jgi:phage baseplate assembly protein V